MRTAFTITARYKVPVSEMETYLRKHFYPKPREEKIRIVENLPTVGILHASRRGIFTYYDDENQTATTIVYRWGDLVVTVVGGTEEQRKEWKTFLRTFNLGPQKRRGRPPANKKAGD